MKVALVHDWLINLGGAERVLKVLHEMFPAAPIYTLFHNPKFTKQFLPGTEIRSSFAQTLYRLSGSHRWLLPLLAVAIESFDLSKFDLVISSSVIFAKGLVLRPHTKHLCYCYSPTRMLWDWNSEYASDATSYKLHSWYIRLAQHFLRLWDLGAAARPDKFIAISKIVQQRIKKYYGIEAPVIYPPMELEVDHHPRDVNFPSEKINSLSPVDLLRGEKIIPLRNHAITQSTAPSGDNLPRGYCLIVSRLYAHKNIDIAIEAFNKLELPLVIVGSGPERNKLKKLIRRPDLIKLVGFVPDEQLPTYYQNAKAFVMPQEEDFGLTPLEAMQYGKPVLALEAGGAPEYIEPGVNGEFFFAPKAEILADGVRRLNENYAKYDPAVIKKAAERFSRPRFEEELRKEIAGLLV